MYFDGLIKKILYLKKKRSSSFLFLFLFFINMFCFVQCLVQHVLFFIVSLNSRKRQLIFEVLKIMVAVLTIKINKRHLLLPLILETRTLNMFLFLHGLTELGCRPKSTATRDTMPHTPGAKTGLTPFTVRISYYG